MKVSEKLRAMGACAGEGDAVPWAEAQEAQGVKTLAELWAVCPRGDWMLWLAARLSPDAREMEAVAWACAHLAESYAAAADDAAYDAAADAYAADAAASRSAFFASCAAFAAADDAAAAAAAVTAAYDAAAAARADYAAARKDCADMVRLLVTRPSLPTGRRS